jgi:hypothetical protein
VKGVTVRRSTQQGRLVEDVEVRRDAGWLICSSDI